MTYGYIIGTTVAGLFVLIGLAAAIIGTVIKPRWRDRSDGSSMWSGEYLTGVWLKWAGLATVVVAAGIWVIAAFPPFETKYHAYRPVSGQVTAIGTRLLGAGSDSGTTQMFVVTMNGHDYRCDDTRCSLVRVGDLLSLQCIGVWELHGTPGYRCNFVSDIKGPS